VCVYVALRLVCFLYGLTSVCGPCLFVQVRLARYDVTLYSLINHNLGKQYFSQHLKTEYSYENMEVRNGCVCVCMICMCVCAGLLR